MPYVKLPGIKFVIPKDEMLKTLSNSIYRDKSLLSHRVKNLLKSWLGPKDLVKRYLGIVELLLKLMRLLERIF
jgi:hypothetical protein